MVPLKSKVLIQIFPLVKDIDYLERTLLLLRQNAAHLDTEKYHVILDVSLPVGDYLTDWDSSILKQDYFITKFEHLKKYGDWCAEAYFKVDYSTKGILDCFTQNLKKYKDVDDIILLETDIIFNRYTLSTLLESAREVRSITSEYIITPEHTKLWDDSWDIVVNSRFISKPQHYRNIGDAIDDTVLIDPNIYLTPLIFGNNKHFKFGGGWFTLYSKRLVDNIGFPDTLQGYGGLDNFIITYCYKTQTPIQYVVRNLVVTEDCKYTRPTLYDEYVKSFNRRKDYYDINNSIMDVHFTELFAKLESNRM